MGSGNATGNNTGKHWWFKLDAAKFLDDDELGECELATVGAWIKIMCAMHKHEQSAKCVHGGELKGSIKHLAVKCRCSPDEFREALRDLRDTNAAIINGNLDRADEEITIVSRKMYREWDDRKKDRERKSSNSTVNSTPGSSGNSSADSTADSATELRVKSSEGRGENLDPNQEGEGDSQGELQGLERKMPPDEIKARWNALAEQAGLPKLNRIKGERLANYRRREEEHPTLWDDPEGNDLETQIPLLNANARGETPDWNGVTFDWLMKNELNIQKCCEGHYKDRKLEKQGGRKKPRISKVEEMIALRSGNAAEVEKYQMRLTMYRNQKDPWGKIKPHAAAILEQLGEATE